MHVSGAVSIPLGIIIGLLASFVQSLGLTIQRKSHVLNANLPEGRQRVEHKRPLWLLGFGIFISSNILGSLVQIASLPVVILAPLGAVSLLWNAFFARFILGDVFSPWMILGTIFIAGGAVLIAVFGIVPEPTRSLEDLLELFRRPAFVVYFSILGAVVFICLALTHFIEYSHSPKLSSSSSPNQTPSFAPLSLNTRNESEPNIRAPLSIAGPETSERTPLLRLKPRVNGGELPQKTLPLSEQSDFRLTTRIQLYLAISYASFSGIISGMCLLFAKSGVELLLLTLHGQNQFWRWQAWILVLGLIIFALLQLWYLHKSLTLADPTLVCPSAFCFYNLSSIVNGLVYFDQFSLIPPLHLALVSLGILVLLAGVWVVSIQSGGGGVDVGTWNEELEPTCDETLSDFGEVESPVEDEYLNRPYLTQSGAMERSPSFGLEAAGTRLGEPLIPNDYGRFRPQNQTSHSQSSEEPTSSDHQALSSQYSRHRYRRRPTLELEQSSSSGPNHFKTGSQTTMPYPHPSPLPVAALGAGFQIGLSPVSPGFTLLPRERRRRATGHAGPNMAGSLVLDTTDSDGIHDRHQPPRRRTVSEGCVTSGYRTGVGASSSDIASNGGRHGGAGQSGGLSGERSDIPRSERTSRWAWLRRVFVRDSD